MHRLLTIMIIFAATIFSLQQLVQFYEAGSASQAGLSITILGVFISLSGAAFATVVIFEALFYPIARIRYGTGDRIGGTIALVMLFIAIGYTFTADFETNATGRADKAAERTAVVDVRADIKKELEDVRAQRAAWKARVETATTTQLKELNEKITQANDRIDKLQKKLEAAHSNAGAAPAAEFLAEHIGRDAGFWAFVLLCFKLLFPACMRAFAWEFVISSADIIKPKGVPFIDRKAKDVTPIEVARSDPNPVQLMQPDPIPQLTSQVKTKEEPGDGGGCEKNKPSEPSLPTSPLPSQPPSPLPSEEGQNVSTKDVSEDGVEKLDRRKVKKQNRRLGRNVVPFAQGRVKSSERTLRDVVIAYCDENHGTIPFGDIKDGLKAYAPKGMKIPDNCVGPILKALGHQWCKPGNIVHYRIGGASQDAVRA